MNVAARLCGLKFSRRNSHQYGCLNIPKFILKNTNLRIIFYNAELLVVALVTASIYLFILSIDFNIATAQLNGTGPLIFEDELGSQFGFQNGSETYKDDDIGFSINYPSDWTIGDQDSGQDTVVSFESPKDDASVDIRVFPSTNKSIKDLGNNLKNNDELTLLAYYRNSSTLLDGKPAFKAIYLTTYKPSAYESALGYSSSTSKAMYTATLVPEKKSFFSFVYFAEPTKFDDYLSVIEEMVKSFKIGSKGPVIQEED